MGMLALAMVEALLCARLSREGGRWWGWWLGELDVDRMCQEFTPTCIITSSGSTPSISFTFSVWKPPLKNSINYQNRIYAEWVLYVNGKACCEWKLKTNIAKCYFSFSGF